MSTQAQIKGSELWPQALSIRFFLMASQDFSLLFSL